MQKTVLYDIHNNLGAKMVPFGGFEMPVEYNGINNEHLAVRQAAGLFDASHMGEFWIKGPNAKALLQHLTTNDISVVPVGKAQYTCMPNEKGGIVDDLIVYHYEEEKYMLVVNASNVDKDWNWCNTQNTFNAELENASSQISLLAVQGPKALEILQKLTAINLSEIEFHQFRVGGFEGCKGKVIISNSGYTGSEGFELYLYNEDAPAAWNAILEAGKNEGIIPAGLGARDTLRLEAGLGLYGNDLNDSTSPIEGGLGWITKLVDGNDFVARDIIEKQKSEGVERRLKGFVMEDRGIPRKDYEIVDGEGNVIGVVTSGTMSPLLKKGIGMGYLKRGFWKSGTEIFIKVRKRLLRASVAKRPFVDLK